MLKFDRSQYDRKKETLFSARSLGPSINGLVTDGNTKLCCRGFIFALFQITTAKKNDFEHTEVIRGYFPHAELKYYELQ